MRFSPGDMYGAFISRRKLRQNRDREGVEYRTPGGQKIDSHFSPIQPPFSHAKSRNWANVLEEHSQGVVRNRKCPFVYNNTHRERRVLNPRLRWSRVVSCAIRKSHTKVFLVVACLAVFRTFVTTMEDVEGEGARCNSSLNVLNTIRVGLLNREDNHNEYSGINVSE